MTKFKGDPNYPDYYKGLNNGTLASIDLLQTSRAAARIPGGFEQLL
jgi:hypothetical protein